MTLFFLLLRTGSNPTRGARSAAVQSLSPCGHVFLWDYTRRYEHRENPSWIVRLYHLVAFCIRLSLQRGSAARWFDGFGVKVGEAQGCRSLAEDVLNFLGCDASDGAAGPLLR